MDAYQTEHVALHALIINVSFSYSEKMKDLTDYSLLAHNTFGIDARCSRFIEYSTVEEARQVADILVGEGKPYIVVGSGSNLLLTADFPGIVVHSAIRGIEAQDDGDGHVLLACGSGEVFDDVVDYAVSHAWYGAENLSLIPGEVGASAVQNIGAYGVEAKDIIDKVEAVEISTGEIRCFDNANCAYGYRQSRFKHEWENKFLITRVVYRLTRRFSPHLDYGNIRAWLEQDGIVHPTARQLRATIIRMRESKLPDPKREGNAGSFFMNPVVGRDKYESLASLYPQMPHYKVDDSHEKIPAGWLIEQCGWKGKNLGRAGVYAKQALVLVNRGGATGEDVVRLCKAIQKDVYEKFGIEIVPEVNIR